VTRAAKSIVRRIVTDTRGQDYVAEVRSDILILRPLRCRRGGPADVSIPWGALYTRALLMRKLPTRRRRVTRGLLTTEGRQS